MSSTSIQALPTEIEDRKILTFQVIKVIAGILLLFFIPLEYLINDSLSSSEKSGMVSIQDNRVDSAVHFFKALTYIGNHIFLIIVFPILYNFYDARKAMKIIIVLCFAMYLYSFLALLYVEPRPFWVSESIKGEICQSGFGNPALELMLVSVLFIYTSVEFFKHRGPIEQAIAYAISASISVLYFTAALYLGEHFLHQCITTVCFAFIFLTSAFALDKYISELTIKSNFGYNENRKNSIYFLIATLTLFLAIIATNNLITNKKGISIYWIKHALAHCSDHYQVNGSSSFYVSAWIFYLQGAVFGCMYTARKLSMFWWMTPYWKRAIRTALAVGFNVGVFLMFNLLDFKSEASNFVFNYVIPLMIMSFVGHGIMPILFAKMHLALRISPDVDDETELSSYYGGI